MAKTSTERVREHRARKNDLAGKLEKARDEINKRRRNKCSKSLWDFILTYCCGDGGFFAWRPYDETRQIVDTMQRSVSSGQYYHIRMTRGGGKTSLMLALIAWCLCYGRAHYVVISASVKPQATVMLEDIWSLFENGEEIGEDFPEVCIPIRALEGSAQKAISQHVGGKRTCIKKSEKFIYFPTVDGSESSGAILVAVGFDGKVRGLRKGKLRPDLVLLDDLQDDEMAANAAQVNKARLKIAKSYLGLGSARHRVSVLMTSTPICIDDLSEQYASDKNWITQTFPLMWTLPKRMDLWKRYAAIKRSAILAGNYESTEADEFYEHNRKAMDECEDGADGMSGPLWMKCYDDKEKSAVQHAMNILFGPDGEKLFDSEYQMKPKRDSFAFDISATLILSRVRYGVPHLTVPDGFVFVAAATDINPSYALTTAIVAFDRDRTAFVTEHVISRIRIDSRVNDTEYARKVYEALSEHGRAIRALGVKLDAWGIDAGGKQFDAVTTFAPMSVQVCGIPACAMVGQSQMKFNGFTRSRLRDALNRTVLCGDRGKKWLFWDADCYKETAQRSWATETGAPGGLSMFDGVDHDEFAIQVANERLVSKRDRADGRAEFTWKTKEPHDYGDCVAMCYAVAASQGLTSGTSAPRPRSAAPARRRVRIV